MNITIVPLKNCSQHISRLAQISTEELGPTWCIDEGHLSKYLHIDELPLTLVALDNDIPVGMCSLTKIKDIRPDLSPWLGPLVVTKQYQRYGIGRQLVEATKQKTHMLGFEKLHLATHDSELAAKYYQPQGWRFIGMDEWKGYPVTVMEIDLLSF